MSASGPWQPTPAHLRAVLGAVGLAGAAVLGRRPDLLVIAAPLVVAAVVGRLRRPAVVPEVVDVVGRPTLSEGQVTTRRVRVEDPSGRVDDVAVVFDPVNWIEQSGHGRIVGGLAADGEGFRIDIRATRWGTRRLAPALVVCSSAGNAYRSVWNDTRVSTTILVLPEAPRFDTTAWPVHSAGLIGANRSPLIGTGTEFASIRPFQLGDRLRRIHWPASMRADRLHVATTHVDQDRHVALLIDAFEDVGSSGGIFGSATSLDIAVRAATSIAGHFARTGDRVSMVPMGARRFSRVPPGIGRRHLRHLLEELARVVPSERLADDGRVPRGLGSGALVMVFSPFLSTGSQQRLAAIARLGLDVVAIDCLPTDIHHQSGDAHTGLLWRIAALERQARLHQVREAGIPVVSWHGPGSLDTVLRALHRRAVARPGAR